MTRRAADIFTLSWFGVPADRDWRNLALSGVKRVMVPYGLARSHEGVLRELAGRGRSVVIRIEEETTQPPAQIGATLAALSRLVRIDAVILGNEPDYVPTKLNFEWGADDWGEGRAWNVRWRTSLWRDAVRSAGLRAVAPALSHPPNVISEDGPPHPGRVTWREICGSIFNNCDGVATHCGYVIGWRSDVDKLRFKFGLKRAAEEWHRQLYIGEATYPTDDDVAQMRCAIEQVEIILHHPAGGRVAMYAPFTSAGTPDGSWPEGYLLTDERAYLMLGQYLAAN